MTLRPIASAVRAIAIPAAIALASLPTAALASTNLLLNGSFEDNVIGAGNYATFGSLIGWTGGAYGIELRNNVVGTAQSGVNFVELDSTENSSMFQTIHTVAGQLYNLSFYFAPRVDVATDSNAIDVFWGSNHLTGISGDGFASTTWQKFTFSVLGTGGDVNLTFAAGGKSDSYGGSLDNVSVTAVPEPETYAMLLAGLGMMGAMVRRRKQK